MSPVVRTVLSLSLVLAIGCAGAGDPGVSPLDAGSGDALPASCDPPQFTYANFGQAFLNTYCNSCHGFTQEDAQLDSSLLMGAAVTSTYMPPGNPPSSTDRMEFGVWLTCGAP